MPHLPAAKASMTIEGERITSDMKKTIREKTHGKQLKNYIIERNKWSESTFNKVDWDNFEIVMKRMKNSSKTRIIKFLHDWLPVGYQQRHIYVDRDPSCPTCNNCKIEKVDHIFRCKERQKTRAECFTHMKNNLSKINTNDNITSTIIKGIKHWVSGFRQEFQVTFPTQDKLLHRIQLAVLEQNEIGWNNLLKGRISKYWGLAQQVHYSERARQCTTKKEKEKAKKYTPDFFQMVLIFEIFKMFETLWTTRNDD